MHLIICVALLLVGVASPAPTSVEDLKKTTIDREYYPKQFVKYEGSHDIVNIAVPINLLNLEDDSSESESEEDKREAVVFFVEADTDENGKRTYHGLYSLKDGEVKKILENGRDTASSSDKNRHVYFAASDGLYTYKEDDQAAVKYGSLGDSIIGIAHTAEGNGLYILTEDNTVYEVKNNGNEKEKIGGIVDAKQIVLDNANNIYFYSSDKKVHVKTTEGVKNIEGLPDNPTKVTLIKPPFIGENGIPVLVDNVAYFVYADGTSKLTGYDFKTDAIPSAFAMEPALVQYYAYDKKIYKYNMLQLLSADILLEINKILNDKTGLIERLIASKRESPK